MHATIDQTRLCTISESIAQSHIEVKKMLEGKMPKRSLSELFAKNGIRRKSECM